MRPFYFPFTTISEPILGALLACFSRVAVYQPSRSHVPETLRTWETRGRLRIYLPDEDENDPLPHLLKAYHAWAELHEGERPDFEKFRPAATPLTDTSATSRIRSDIRKAAEKTETGSPREDKKGAMLLRARLFLTVAQEHDQLRQTLREDLDRIGNMEKNLFRNLLEDHGKPFQRSTLDRPTGEIETDCYMYGERLTAWSRLHVHHQKSTDAGTASIPETPELLITSDRLALDQLLEQADTVESICSVSGIPFGPPADITGDVFFDKKRCDKLRKLAADPARQGGWDAFFSDAGNGTGDNTGRLTIYRIRGDAVTNFLSKSADAPGPSRIKEETVRKQFTLAGSIAPTNP